MRIPIRIRAMIHVMIQFGFIIFFGWYYNKLLNVLIIVPFFFIFRKCYTKVYHAPSYMHCTIYTICIFIAVLFICLNQHISILFSILLCYIMNLISYHLRVYIDLKKEYNKLTSPNKSKREIILQYVKNNEEAIEELCSKFVENNLAETVYLYLNNTIEDTADILNISTRTVNRRIDTFIRNVTKMSLSKAL